MQRIIPGIGVGTIPQALLLIPLGIILRMGFIAVLFLLIRPDLLWAQGCNVGVNVNSFQNFDAAEQETIVQQLVNSGARCVRTSLRPDDKNIHLAKELQDKGVGLVLVLGAEFLPNAPLRKLPIFLTDGIVSHVHWQEPNCICIPFDPLRHPRRSP